MQNGNSSPATSPPSVTMATTRKFGKTCRHAAVTWWRWMKYGWTIFYKVRFPRWFSHFHLRRPSSIQTRLSLNMRKSWKRRRRRRRKGFHYLSASPLNDRSLLMKHRPWKTLHFPSVLFSRFHHYLLTSVSFSFGVCFFFSIDVFNSYFSVRRFMN